MVDSEYTYCKVNQGDWRATRARTRSPRRAGLGRSEARRRAKPSRAELSERSDVMQYGESFAGYQSRQLREFILVTATY